MTFDERLPVVEVRLARLDGDFVATFAERVSGHLWRVGRDDLGWSWILGRIAASEREAVLDALDAGIAAFRRIAQADARMIATAVEDGRTAGDEDKKMLLDAARRVELSLRAIYDLQDDRAAVASNQPGPNAIDVDGVTGDPQDPHNAAASSRKRPSESGLVE